MTRVTLLELVGVVATQHATILGALQRCIQLAKRQNLPLTWRGYQPYAYGGSDEKIVRLGRQHDQGRRGVNFGKQSEVPVGPIESRKDGKAFQNRQCILD